MTLKEEILNKVKKSKDCRRALEDRWGKSFYTIDKWLKENNPLLCHPDSLSIIAAYLKEDFNSLTIE